MPSQNFEICSSTNNFFSPRIIYLVLDKFCDNFFLGNTSEMSAYGSSDYWLFFVCLFVFQNTVCLSQDLAVCFVNQAPRLIVCVSFGKLKFVHYLNNKLRIFLNHQKKDI